jgi:hypothetical protein
VTDDPYSGPSLSPNPRAVDAVKARIRSFIERRADEIHYADVKAWAEANDGDYPSRCDAIREAREDAEVLFRALGRWAAVPPDWLSPSRRRGRSLLDTLGWDFDPPSR